MSLEREVGEIHTKVNSILALLSENRADITSLEKEVDGLKKWQHMIIGGFTSIGAVVGAFSTKIFDKLSGL